MKGLILNVQLMIQHANKLLVLPLRLKLFKMLAAKQKTIYVQTMLSLLLKKPPLPVRLMTQHARMEHQLRGIEGCHVSYKTPPQTSLRILLN